VIQGKVWKFGDHINTDLIIPGRYLDDYNIHNLAKHVMEDADPEFAKRLQKGDVIVAGRNFGCGSSREQAPAALKMAGVAAVVADSFARIFYRNAINVGLPVIVCPGAAKKIAQGEIIEIDLERGTIRAEAGQQLKFNPLPAFLREILDAGGLVPYARKRLASR
jgi:3-isopropylmalate dehydratase small subunit